MPVPVIIKGAITAKFVKRLIEAYAPKAIDAATKMYSEKAEEKKTLIEITELTSPDYHLTLDVAKRLLEDDGLKVESIVVKPDVKYKDYIDMEVVATNYNYKNKQKVKPGTRIILKYVTSEVIEASKRLFDEAEKAKADEVQAKVALQEEKLRQKAELQEAKAKQKAELQEAKAAKKAEQNAKTKQKLDETVASVQQGLNTVAKKITRK